MWARFTQWLEAKIFPTWSELLEQEAQKAHTEIDNARVIINKHWYLEHMALFKLEGIDAWHRGERRGGPKPGDLPPYGRPLEHTGAVCAQGPTVGAP